MGIKDIPLSTTAQPLAVPKPPELETILQINNKGSVASDPQSGSILKILAENGFKEKIQDGYAKGHTYTILHAAPSTDFTLIDTWTENTVDEEGNTVSKPRKAYQFFKIQTEEIIVQPKEIEAPVASPTIVETTPVPVIETIPTEEKPVQPQAPVVAAIPEIPAPETLQVNRAEEIANKIKKGGAAMTPEDWQYRNENWPAIEKYLGPNTQKVPPVQVSTSTQIEEKTIPITNTETTTSGLTTQHYDSKAWLMKKLGSPQATPAATSPSSAPKTTGSSYDLLKKKFAKPFITNSVPNESAPPIEVKTPEERKKIFLESIFGTTTSEWDGAKQIPARAFIYPTEYAWGTDATGNQIDKSLEDYPPLARKLREKIAQSVEDVSTKGVDIETSTLEQVITAIFDKNIL